MNAAIEQTSHSAVLQDQREWHGPGPLSPDFLKRVQEGSVPTPERWRFTPFPIAIYDNPADGRSKDERGKNIPYPTGTKDRRDPRVDTVVQKLVSRLTAPDLGNTLVPLTELQMNKKLAKIAARASGVRILDKAASSDFAQRILGKAGPGNSDAVVPKVVIRPGTGELDVLLSPLDYMNMPDPKPFFFYVSVVDKLPKDHISKVDHQSHSAEDFDYSRQQLARAAVHNGVIFEQGERGFITGFWWFSTQGNHQVVRIDEEVLLNASDEKLAEAEKVLLDSVALRVCVHHGDEFLTERSDYKEGVGEPIIDWESWTKNSVHKDLHKMAHDLSELGYLDDHVDIKTFTPDELKHGQRISDAINRSDLGEGMYSSKIGKVVAMSPSGGKKVKWTSEDPNIAVHLTPLSHMTANGTVVYTPTGAPEKAKFEKGSVEARENLDAYIMRQMYASGQVVGEERNQKLIWYENWEANQLREKGMIPVYQEGTPQEDFTIVHLHGMPEGEVDPDKVEIVEPDYTLYPQVDMACGTRGGNGSLRSALARSKWFTGKFEEGKHFLDGRSIVVRLRGHGIVMLAKSPAEAVRAIKEMDFRRPASLTA